MGNYEELPSVEENRVDLHHEGECPICHILPTSDSQRKAKNHQEVVDQQLVGAAFPVVDHHVQRIIEKISNRKTDQGMT